MALLIVLLVCLWISLTDSIPPTVTEGESSLNQRMSRMEQLVIQQDLVIQQLERDKQQWKREKQQLSELRDEWQKTKMDLERDKQQCGELKTQWQQVQQRWNCEMQDLKDDFAVLQGKHEKASNGSATKVKSSVHNVVPRSDDTNPLEPVVTQMVQRVTEMSAELQMLRNSVQEAGSSIYVRWGNSVCPNTTSLVYAGVVGGSDLRQSGAAANHLCLSLEPVPSDQSFTSAHATLYGSEYYDTQDGNHGKDAVCAVCRPHHSTVIMIPGTNKCQSGWTMEYSGFLMAGYYVNSAATEFICVDDHFGSRIGGDAQQLGRLLMYTVTVCGSLPCGPYTDNKVVTCAVCSK